MARLSEIRSDPSSYLGTSGNEATDRASWDLYIEAVEALVTLGVDEVEAGEVAFGDGDFVELCGRILANPAAYA